MSAFARAYCAPEPSFTPLFRLLNDFDSYSRDVSAASHRSRPAKVFNPRFDVRETEENYELLGDLPGVEKDNVHIEFTDHQTIVIRGRVERSYASGKPPAAAIQAEEPAEDTASQKSYKATVENEDETDGTVTEQPTPATTTAEVAEPEQQPAAPKPRYWVSERSVGEFSRSFSFANRIEQDGVSANLNNGVLTVVVPKAKKHEAHRIAIF